MKRISILVLILMLGLFFAAGATAADKAAIQKNVDGIVAEIDGGKKAADFKAGDYNPYVFVMEENGMVIVHPSLIGKSLKEAAKPAYDAVIQATSEGNWVKYEWEGKEKNSYVKKTKGGLIVGSGY